MPKLPRPPVPTSLAADARSARARPRRPKPLEPRQAEARHPRRRLDRRAHLAVRRRPLADVPQGPEGHQLVLHARLGDDVRLPLQAVTGVFLAMYYDPSPTQRLRVDPPHHQRRLPRRVRARHAQVGLDGDGDPGLPAHGRTFFFGAYKYPRELNWVIGVVLLILTMVMSLHRLPAAVRPALLLGDDRGVNINGTGPLVGPYLADFLRGGAGVRRHDAVALLRDPHAARSRADRRADRRAPLPRRPSSAPRRRRG